MTAAATSARVALPDPVAGPTNAGVITYVGGVQVMGPLVKIPGRTLDVDHLDEAEQHAAAVLAAVRQIRAGLAVVAADFPPPSAEEGTPQPCAACPGLVDMEDEHVTVVRQAIHDLGGQPCVSAVMVEQTDAHYHAGCFVRITAGRTDWTSVAAALFGPYTGPAAIPASAGSVS